MLAAGSFFDEGEYEESSRSLVLGYEDAIELAQVVSAGHFTEQLKSKVQSAKKDDLRLVFRQIRGDLGAPMPPFEVDKLLKKVADPYFGCLVFNTYQIDSFRFIKVEVVVLDGSFEIEVPWASLDFKWLEGLAKTLALPLLNSGLYKRSVFRNPRQDRNVIVDNGTDFIEQLSQLARINQANADAFTLKDIKMLDT